MTRMGGAHLHLCYDGNEPPTSFHIFDDGIHHEVSDANLLIHQDADVALAGDFVSKLDHHGFDLPLIIFVITLLWALSPFLFFILPTPVPGVYASTLFHRPPSQGPPQAYSI